MKRLRTPVAAIMLVIGVDGCMLGPDYKRPEVAVPASYRGVVTPDGASTGLASLGVQKWDTVFTDPVLKSLIAEALKNNYDLKIAADRIAEQEAQVGKIVADEYPTLNVGGTLDAVRLPSSINSHGSSGGSANLPTRISAGGLTWSAAWNIDFWGYYRRQSEAARAELRATDWARQSTYSNLVQKVATSYYQLRALDAEMQITRDTIKARRESLDLTRRLEESGSDTLADVRQAEELYYAAVANVPDVERQIEQQENDLAYLLGRPPGPINRGDSIVTAAHPDIVPAGLPSDLLERRPDVRRAEELLVQANANIGVAKAQFFPQLSLSDSGGIISTQLKGIVQSKNLYTYAAASLTQPIFDAGKLIANYHLSKAQYQEVLETYKQTISAALRDTSNALVAYRKTREYRELQEKQTAAATDAVRLARMRFESGSTSYLEVLTTDTNLYSSQLTLESAELQEALALVQLYNALGGGW